MKKVVIFILASLLLTACSTSISQEEIKKEYSKIINNLDNQNYTVEIKSKTTNKEGKVDLFYEDYTAIATVKVGKENDEYIIKYTNNLEDAEDKNLGMFLMKDGTGTKSEKCPFELTDTKYSNMFKNEAEKTWKEDKDAKTITFTKEGYEATLKYNDKELPISFESTTTNEKTIVESYTFNYDKIDEDAFVLNEDSKPSEEETTSDKEQSGESDNVAQNGSNQGSVASNNNVGTSNESSSSNTSSNNNSNSQAHKYFDGNGNPITKEQYEQIIADAQKPPEENYACPTVPHRMEGNVEVWEGDPNLPCDWTPSNLGNTGLEFKTEQEAWDYQNHIMYELHSHSGGFAGPSPIYYNGGWVTYSPNVPECCTSGKH